MYLDDIVTSPDSKTIAKVCKKIFGHSIDLSKLNESKARKLAKSLNESVRSLEGKLGSKCIESTQYLETKMARDTVMKHLEETVKEGADPGTENLKKGEKVKITGGDHRGKTGTIKKADVRGTNSLVTVDGNDEYIPTTHLNPVKESKKENMKESMYKRLGALTQKYNKLVESASSSKGSKKELKQLAEQISMLRAGVKKMRKLNENDTARAEVTMAAKDMVDRIQGMLEDLGEMQNEDLPPLTDSVRQTLDQQKAQQFNDTMSDAINSALEAMRNARSAANDASLMLAGEEPTGALGAGPDMGAEPDMDDSPELGGDLDLDLDLGGDDDFGGDEGFDGADAADGDVEPMGRAKRA